MIQETGTGLAQGISGALLVGLAGFLYLHASYYQRFKHAAASQSTRTSLAFALGLGLLLVTSVGLVVLQEFVPRLVVAIHSRWQAISPLPGLDTVFILAPAVGLLCGLGGNVIGLVRVSDAPYLNDPSHPLHSWALRRRMLHAAVDRVARETHDGRLFTLWRALERRKLLQITAKGREVFIGWPVSMADPSLDTPWLHLVPIATGYRDADGPAFEASTGYLELFDTLPFARLPSDAIDLGILVSWEEVESLSIYNPQLGLEEQPNPKGNRQKLAECAT
jgi:hypothetical protein